MRNMAASHGFSFYFYDKDQLDVTRSEQWQQVIHQVKPDAIINAAAYTAVEQAELHPDEAMLLNREAPAIGADRAFASGIPFIQLSTDYVFNGRKHEPYNEDDVPEPLSVYGRSKFEGEQKVLQAHPGAWVIRLSWMYSQFSKNFMNTMLYRFASNDDVRVVNDQISTPTCAVTFGKHLADFITAAQVKATPGGVYHYSMEGQASWYELAVAIRDSVNSRSQVTPIASDAYSSGVKRPAYSKLDNTRFKQVLGYDLPHWTEGLQNCMQ